MSKNVKKPFPNLPKNFVGRCWMKIAVCIVNLIGQKIHKLASA